MKKLFVILILLFIGNGTAFAKIYKVEKCDYDSGTNNTWEKFEYIIDTNKSNITVNRIYTDEALSRINSLDINVNKINKIQTWDYKLIYFNYPYAKGTRTSVNREGKNNSETDINLETKRVFELIKFENSSDFIQKFICK